MELHERRTMPPENKQKLVPEGSLTVIHRDKVLENQYPLPETGRGLLMTIDSSKGAGKSTARQGLLTKLNAEGYETGSSKETELFMPDILARIREKRRALVDIDEDSILNLITAARRDSTPNIERLLRLQPNIVYILERSYIQTLVKQLYHGDGKIQDRFKDVLTTMKGSYPIADVAIMLACNPREAYRRIVARNRPVETLAIESEVGREIDVFNRIYRAIPPESTYIDTTTRTPEEVVEIIWGYVVKALKEKGIRPKAK